MCVCIYWMLWYIDIKASSGVGLVRIIWINGEIRLSSQALIVSRISCSITVFPFQRSGSERMPAVLLAGAMGWSVQEMVISQCS